MIWLLAHFFRHPGYFAMLVSMPATALTLGSCLALIPALAFSVVILRRASREDKFLKAHLAGFTRYAETVKHRLLPGIW
jgi:protein-S-isoprenylcysteine O-methyltransferase Ste14